MYRSPIIKTIRSRLFGSNTAISEENGRDGRRRTHATIVIQFFFLFHLILRCAKKLKINRSRRFFIFFPFARLSRMLRNVTGRAKSSVDDRLDCSRRREELTARKTHVETPTTGQQGSGVIDRRTLKWSWGTPMIPN